MSFQIEPRTYYETSSNTDYSSNYNKIFEINGPKPNSQTVNNEAISKLDIYFGSGSSSKTNYRNDNIFQNNIFVNSINHCGLSSRSFLFYRLDETQSMVNFNILQLILFHHQIPAIVFF